MATSLETPAKGEVHVLERSAFSHLSDEEWIRLQQMQDVCGMFAVKDLLNRPHEDQHEALRHFGLKIDGLQTQFAASARPMPPAQGFQGPSLRPLKTEVSIFRGNEGEPLRYWLAELAIAF